MRRILSITPSLYGGAGSFITSWISFLQENGYENTIITSGEPGQYEDWAVFLKKLGSCGVEIINLDFFHRDCEIFWTNCKAFFEILRENDFSLIHTHSALPTLASSVTLEITRKKIPLIASFYSFGLGRPSWMDFADFFSFRKADKVLTISEHCKGLLINNGIPDSKVELIPIGVNFGKIEESKRDKKKIREELSLSGDDIVLLQLAAIEKRKNQLMAVKILEGLKEKEDKKFKLLLVGDKKELDYRLEIEDFIERKGLKDDVILTGKVEDPYRYLFASDLFIFPTLSEGLGLAMIEAMAAKIPVFATYIEGTRDILRDDENAFVIPPDDPETAVNKIIDLLKDREKEKTIIYNAYEFVRGNFDLQKTFEDYLDVYEKSLS